MLVEEAALFALDEEEAAVKLVELQELERERTVEAVKAEAMAALEGR